MTKVAFFANQFADAAGHGLARYARELHGELLHQPGLTVTPVAAWSSLPPPELAALGRRTGLRLLPTGRRVTPLAWTFLGTPAIERALPDGADVVHAASLGYPVATRRPLVVTIHDLGPLTHPEYFRNTRPWVMRRALAQAERQADLIACVSRSTAEEVADYLGPAIRPRLRVVHEGVSDRFFTPAPADVLAPLGLPPDTPFVLCAGKLSPRKNVQAVLRVMDRLGPALPHHLVLVGGAGWDLNKVLGGGGAARLGDRLHVLDYVTDAQLTALYAAAQVYVHPSLYEGFGLTVLEAMAAGAPVITSDTSSLPEVAGDAATLVPPSDTDALAQALEALCTDEGLRHRHVAAGRRRAAAFRWSRCAEAMAGYYRQLAA